MSPADDYLETFCKETYKAELDRSEKLDTQINVPTALATVFLGASAFYFENLPKGQWGNATTAFYASLTIYLLAIGCTVFCIIRSYKGYEYFMMPSPRRLRDRIRELRIYYTEYYGTDEASREEMVKELVKGEFIDLYAECVENNRANNVRRTTWIFWTVVLVVVTLISLILSRIILYIVLKS